MNPRVPGADQRWIFNPILDLLVGCGAWSLPLLVASFWLNLHDAVYLPFAFYFLGVFCNQPHYMATIYRAYRTREDFNKYRFFTLYVTALAILAVVVVHVAPALFPWVFTAYLTWSPWHYTGQNYGIAMMLARRAGAQPTAEDRSLIWWAYLASYLAWFLALHNVGTPGDASLVILPIPEVVAQLGEIFFLCFFVIAIGYGHLRLVRQVGLRAMAGSLVMASTQFLWFLLPLILRETQGLQLPVMYSSAGILAFMHCAQYLWVTTYYSRRDAEVLAPRRAKASPFSFWHYYLILVVGGVALFVPGPWLASRVLGRDLVESYFIFVALVNLHHFILDGAIWKLRDGRIARLLLGRNPPSDDDPLTVDPTAGRTHLGWFFGTSRVANRARWALGAVLLALAAVDQLQYGLTLKTAGQPALDLASQINPQDTRIYFQRAKRLTQSGDTIGAMRELRAALAISPRNAAAQHLLGELLYRSGDVAAALDHYDRMAAIFRPDLVVLVNRGMLSAQHGDAARSLELFKAALQLAPHNTDLHLYLAEAYAAVGDRGRALQQFELYAELHQADREIAAVLPTYLQVGLKLGEIYRGQSDLVHAAAWYREVAVLARAHGRLEEVSAAERKLEEIQIKR